MPTPAPLKRVTRAATAVKRASTARDDAIRAAHPEASIRQIAAAADLHPSRVHQIIHGK